MGDHKEGNLVQLPLPFFYLGLLSCSSLKDNISTFSCLFVTGYVLREMFPHCLRVIKSPY